MTFPQRVTLSMITIIILKDDDLIILRANVYPVPDVLVGIYQNIIPLYSLIMSKHNSLVQLVGTDKKRKKEYTIWKFFFINGLILIKLLL